MWQGPPSTHPPCCSHPQCTQQCIHRLLHSTGTIVLSRWALQGSLCHFDVCKHALSRGPPMSKLHHPCKLQSPTPGQGLSPCKFMHCFGIHMPDTLAPCCKRATGNLALSANKYLSILCTPAPCAPEELACKGVLQPSSHCPFEHTTLLHTTPRNGQDVAPPDT